MSWNYRVVRSNNILSVREVYYDDNNNPKSMTVNPITLEAYEDDGETVDDILEILNKIKVSIETQGILDDPWPTK